MRDGPTIVGIRGPVILMVVTFVARVGGVVGRQGLQVGAPHGEEGQADLEAHFPRGFGHPNPQTPRVIPYGLPGMTRNVGRTAVCTLCVFVQGVGLATPPGGRLERAAAQDGLDAGFELRPQILRCCPFRTVEVADVEVDGFRAILAADEASRGRLGSGRCRAGTVRGSGVGRDASACTGQFRAVPRAILPTVPQCRPRACWFPRHGKPKPMATRRPRIVPNGIIPVGPPGPSTHSV